MIAIFSVLLVVLSFSLGVEKGRRNLPKVSISSQPVNLLPAEKKVISKTVVAPQIKKDLAIISQSEKVLSPVKNYTVQVATFKQQASVQLESAKLKKLGYEIWVRPSGEYSQLCVGRFASKEEAEAFRKKLEKKYSDCLIRRI